MILECYGNKMASLLPAEIKLKMALTFKNYWLPYPYLLLWLLFKGLGHSKLDSQEAKGNYLIDISAKKFKKS